MSYIDDENIELEFQADKMKQPERLSDIENDKIAERNKRFDEKFGVGEGSIQFYSGLRGDSTYERNLYKMVKSHLNSELFLSHTETLKKVEEIVKTKSKTLKYRFWFCSGEDKYKGEFEMYGEYEPFYKFVQKEIRSILSAIRDIK